MVDVSTSCHYTDIISEDIDESINMCPSIDRVSIGLWAVITIDCGLELLVLFLFWSLRHGVPSRSAPQYQCRSNQHTSGPRVKAATLRVWLHV
ncbi:unnamed protein product [Arctia plantaginis]|uniref:Uncharacterized protein n=1 Tax=Arctia plantaginis TaxID=874455 RepID=A0A8S1BA58_ARCPL|nr:unnamed protein product [Arctia plantaginis]